MEPRKWPPESSQKDLNGSLKECEDELRDAYMNYKELAERCKLQIQDHKKDHEQVFYFKPDTVLLQEPEKQR